MKPNSSNLKNILIAVGVLLLIGFATYYFFGRDTATVGSLSSGPAGEVSGVDGELLSTLRQLESLKLDGTIFDNAVFKKLIDYSQPLLPQPIGRSNPFAPTSTSSSSSR